MNSNKKKCSVLVSVFLIGSFQPLFAEGYDLSECEEVHTIMEDPFPPIGDEAAEMVAGIVCEKVHELAPLFDVELNGHRMVKLMITESMESFHKITGRGQYTLAVFSSRIGIVTQPAKTLQALSDRKKLEGTLAHELTHYFIHKVAGPTCPSWLHEGLAQWFEGLHPRQGILMSTDDITKMEVRWHMRATPITQRSHDYQTSLMLVAKIIRRAGQANLLASLKDIPNYPNTLDLPVNGRPIRQWLLSADEPEDEQDGSQSSQLEIVRGEKWQKRLEEEFSQPDRTGKVIRFGNKQDAEVTPLPLDEMLKKAKRNKRRSEKLKK